MSKEKKMNEDKLILGLFVSFNLYFYLLIMLNVMHHDILSKPFPVISSTVWKPVIHEKQIFLFDNEFKLPL